MGQRPISDHRCQPGPRGTEWVRIGHRSAASQSAERTRHDLWRAPGDANGSVGKRRFQSGYRLGAGDLPGNHRLGERAISLPPHRHEPHRHYRHRSARISARPAIRRPRCSARCCTAKPWTSSRRALNGTRSPITARMDSPMAPISPWVVLRRRCGCRFTSKSTI